MVRQVDIISYLPPFLQNFVQFIRYAGITNPELQLLWDGFGKTFRNLFIITAYSDGLDRFEKIMGVKPDGDLETRRVFDLNYWAQDEAYTLLRLRAVLDGLVGVENYYIDASHLTEYKIGFYFNNISNKNIRAVDKMLSYFGWIPCNLELYVEFKTTANKELFLNSGATQYRLHRGCVENLNAESQQRVYLYTFSQTEVLSG